MANRLPFDLSETSDDGPVVVELSDDDVCQARSEVLTFPAPPPELDRQMLYVMSLPNGVYKIGVAADPESRLRELQTANPEKIELCFAVKGRQIPELEGKLHSAFAANRQIGEWFSLNINDLVLLGRIIVEHNWGLTPRRSAAAAIPTTDYSNW